MIYIILALLGSLLVQSTLDDLAFQAKVIRMKHTLALRKVQLAESDRRWGELMERVDSVKQRGAEIRRQYESKKADAEQR